MSFVAKGKFFVHRYGMHTSILEYNVYTCCFVRPEASQSTASVGRLDVGGGRAAREVAAYKKRKAQISKKYSTQSMSDTSKAYNRQVKELLKQIKTRNKSQETALEEVEEVCAM